MARIKKGASKETIKKLKKNALRGSSVKCGLFDVEIGHIEFNGSNKPIIRINKEHKSKYLFNVFDGYVVWLDDNKKHNVTIDARKNHDWCLFDEVVWAKGRLVIEKYPTTNIEQFYKYEGNDVFLYCAMCDSDHASVYFFVEVQYEPIWENHIDEIITDIKLRLDDGGAPFGHGIGVEIKIVPIRDIQPNKKSRFNSANQLIIKESSVKNTGDLQESPLEDLLYSALSSNTKALMIPQFSIGNYRADFAIPSKKVVIEVDGHDYHSSPEQKLHDSKRDRFMVSQGWRVLRFTGREVYHDVEAVVKEIEGIINP